MNNVWLVIAESGDYEYKETYVASAWMTESDAEAERKRLQAEADRCHEKITDWLNKSVAIHEEWRRTDMISTGSVSYNPPRSYVIERIGEYPSYPDDLADTYSVVCVTVRHGASKPHS